MKKNDAISRSAVMSAALEKLTIGRWEDGTPVLRKTITAQELDRLLIDALALDVQPVVHARWLTWAEALPLNTLQRKDSLGVFCDACKMHNDNCTDYCPNCGAKMDGGREK